MRPNADHANREDSVDEPPVNEEGNAEEARVVFRVVEDGQRQHDERPDHHEHPEPLSLESVGECMHAGDSFF